MRWPLAFLLLCGCGLILDLDEPAADAGRDAQEVDAPRPDGTLDPDAPDGIAPSDAPVRVDAVAPDGGIPDADGMDTGGDANTRCEPGCTAPTVCVAGECQAPCGGVVCGAGAACLMDATGASGCVAGCLGVECAVGEVCREGGVCECPSPCTEGICTPSGGCRFPDCRVRLDCQPNIVGQTCYEHRCDSGDCYREPRRSERDGESYNPECDQCNPRSGTWRPTDLDGDGFAACSTECDRVTNCDCNDDDPTTYPGALETLDGVDQNCDSRIGPLVSLVCFVDDDRDGYPVISSTLTSLACVLRGGIAMLGITLADRRQDCDDSEALINPGIRTFSAVSTEGSCMGFGCGYDWNCDGWDERELPAYERCRFGMTEETCTDALGGWPLDSGIMECGGSGTFYGCEWRGGGCFGFPMNDTVQRCR